MTFQPVYHYSAILWKVDITPVIKRVEDEIECEAYFLIAFSQRHMIPVS